MRMLGVIHPYIVFEKAEKPTVLYTVYFSFALVLKLVRFEESNMFKDFFQIQIKPWTTSVSVADWIYLS